MDLDRPLDELISDKRKATRTERAERTDRTERPRAPRQSSDRRAPVPYAVGRVGPPTPSYIAHIHPQFPAWRPTYSSSLPSLA
jgi:hypothetical protein